MNDDLLTELALAGGGGDRHAVEAFVRATQRDVWRFVAHLADPEAADDLAQETFLRALRGLPGFTGRASARTWLLSIARRTVVDRYRRSAVRPRNAGLPDWEEAVDRRPAPPGGFEEGVALADLLARIPADRREVFVLTQVLGYSYQEAAAVCGCPVGTVRSRLARARDELVRMVHAAEDRGPGLAPAGGRVAERGRAAVGG
ncbi:sigma-70 family RNA polymerase sigma factor [Kitasatospora sp. NPDC094015]|uniref:sigma-70 family RNA polymerase sigma factor n=1 Tax=Kitasatospora sp. NPDC094015 TaxID=3155205 RepID=UPI00331E467E